jgi:hypothetical protein
MKKMKNPPISQGAFLSSEEVVHFDHALNKLETARQTLQSVASGMQPAGATRNN